MDRWRLSLLCLWRLVRFLFQCREFWQFILLFWLFSYIDMSHMLSLWYCFILLLGRWFHITASRCIVGIIFNFYAYGVGEWCQWKKLVVLTFPESLQVLGHESSCECTWLCWNFYYVYNWFSFADIGSTEEYWKRQDAAQVVALVE